MKKAALRGLLYFYFFIERKNMATNFVQDGRMLDYTNSTSADITSG
ncbi:DUF2190 family protein [Microbulbifer sp. A4B17]|nr:DUF2190 family protein [Microbulbifer sp. A4B17]